MLNFFHAILDINSFEKSTIFILRKGIGVGGPENGNFPLFYVMKYVEGGWF